MKLMAAEISTECTNFRLRFGVIFPSLDDTINVMYLLDKVGGKSTATGGKHDTRI